MALAIAGSVTKRLRTPNNALHRTSMRADAIIDTHQSFWDPQRGWYPQLHERPDLQRRFSPDELKPTMAAAGVNAGIAIQSWASLTETLDLLASAGSCDTLVGVVGWVDLSYPLLTEVLEYISNGPGGHYLVGVRHALQQESDPEWVLRDDVLRGLDILQQADISFDLAVGMRELPAALELACQLPQLRCIIEHCGRPPPQQAEFHEWAELLAPLGEQANVWCKLSGLAAFIKPPAATDTPLARVLEHVTRVFDEDRLLFGSDWPFCLQHAAYAEVKEALEDALDGVTAAWGKIFDANARTVYRLL